MTTPTDPGNDGLRTTFVDDIPVLYAPPAAETDRHRLALWLHFLGGRKEAMSEYLLRLAAAGFTAVSLDAWRHGERSGESATDPMARALEAFRREVWPILGHTTLDALRVVDWALETFDLKPSVVAGGVSMGGDVAVALAGVDPRVARVAAMVATPDWTRPGMAGLDGSSPPLVQGEPTAYGQWLYDRLDPMTHLDAFRRGPAITFELGAADRHIPPANAHAFRDALADVAPRAAERVRIREHPGLDHLGGARDPDVQSAALAWLLVP